MIFLTLWFIIFPVVSTVHEIEFSDFKCSTSAKKSAEMTNCVYGGRFISFDLNFLRRLDDWKVSQITNLLFNF